MIAQVKLPDGTTRQLNSSGECADLIQEIDAEHSAAAREHRRFDAALWAKAHEDAFASLPALMIEELIREKSDLQPIKRDAELCASWWLELQLAAHGREPVEVSAAQRAILEGNKFAPSNWREAREAIEMSDAFRVPSFQLPFQAEAKAADILRAAKSLELAIDASIDALKMARTSRDAWADFQTGTYQQYLKARGAFEIAMEALYGDK